MSDKMLGMSFENLIKYICADYRHNKRILGIHDNLFFRGITTSETFLERELSLPLGLAAGPHTQMAQNIISGYLCGARFFELKTVQIKDNLEIEKPCIFPEDECYNTEWSTELSVDEAFDEYLKAWIILHLLNQVIFNGKQHFIFNMSVGYNYQGILSEKIDNFINCMKGEKVDYRFSKYLSVLNSGKNKKLLTDTFGRGYTTTVIPSSISNSVTLSTMHGCPSQEIEQICRYLLSEKGLHTFVKLNPTLLGYKKVRFLLDKAGYNEIVIHEKNFTDDLQYRDALGILKRLKSFAGEVAKTFGIKLSNTLPVINSDFSQTTQTEKYLSGKPLLLITLNLVKLLLKDNKPIKISYSGGADQFITSKLAELGLKPVTMASWLLKPGGYTRLLAIASDLAKKYTPQKDDSIDYLMLNKLISSNYKIPVYRIKKETGLSIKSEEKLPLLDCYKAPCKENCPANQDIPEYIAAFRDRQYEQAMEIIKEKNPLPFTTGMICEQTCVKKCTRIDYEHSLNIRSLKYNVAVKAEKYASINLPPKKISAMIIGAGPAGLSAAYYLSKSGIEVTIFEKEDIAGGIISRIIPSFRQADKAFAKDFEQINKSRITFMFNSEIPSNYNDLLNKYDYCIIAAGAQLVRKPDIPGQNDIIDALTFLKDFNHPSRNLLIGRNVAVIGGGNSAIDSARAAMRCDNVENVTILYRRTKNELPADRDEFAIALHEGIRFMELVSPLSYCDKKLTVGFNVMTESGEDGRRNFSPTGKQSVMEFDTVISAIGELPDPNLLSSFYLKVSEVKTKEILQGKIWIAGDAFKGPASVIQAISDGKEVADAILKKNGMLKTTGKQKQVSEEYIRKIEWRKHLVVAPEKSAEKEAERCLECNLLCNKCVDVCPNRANIAIKVQGEAFRDFYQILHFDDFCNECGNCTVFCPYSGLPYRDKFTLFSNPESMANSSNPGIFINKDEMTLYLRLQDKIEKAAMNKELSIDNEKLRTFIETIISTDFLCEM